MAATAAWNSVFASISVEVLQKIIHLALVGVKYESFNGACSAVRLAQQGKLSECGAHSQTNPLRFVVVVIEGWISDENLKSLQSKLDDVAVNGSHVHAVGAGIGAWTRPE